MRSLCQQFVIQDVDSGLFLASDLTFCRSFAGAGRCLSADEAVETATDNLDPGSFWIHRFYDYWDDDSCSASR